MNVGLRTHVDAEADFLSLDAFISRWSPRLHTAMQAEVTALQLGFPPLDDALARLLGVEGGPGRRWRPLLTLASAEALGAEGQDALPVAVAVELTHAASLALDDLPCMDDAVARRGQPATHRLVGSAGAILLSVGLLARAAELLADSDRDAAALCGTWARAFGLHGMSGGQAVDVAGKPGTGPRRRLFRCKSTSLAAFAVRGGAVRAGAQADTCDALERFGTALGWAYQLADDATDLAQDAAAGHPPGGRNPQRQSRYLMQRAARQLARSAVLDTDGARLLTQLGWAVLAGGATFTTTTRQERTA
ncbi:MAG: polyprenyl synthetase family protein [Gemmatimonadota bacterium]|nr:polyprenyl synthetase family protein [Gemmatimonadota bacterium]